MADLFSEIKSGCGKRAAALLALLAGGLLGCGERGRPVSAAPGLPPPAWLTGAWTGTFPGSEDVALALILPSGACRILNGAKLGQIAGKLTLAGNTLGGSGSFFLPGSNPVSKSATGEARFQFDGKAAQGPTPSVNMVLVNTDQRWDVATLDLTPDPAASSGRSLAALAGSYACEESSTGAPATLEVRADGTLSGRDSSGTFSGTLTEAAPGINALQVTLNYAAAAGKPGATFTGLAFYRAERGAPGSLVLMTDGGRSEFSGIFTLSQPPRPAGELARLGSPSMDAAAAPAVRSRGALRISGSSGRAEGRTGS